MHVRKGHRSLGLGGELFQELLRRLGPASPTHLYCLEDNTKAISFYIAHGGRLEEGIHSERGFREREITWYLQRI